YSWHIRSFGRANTRVAPLEIQAAFTSTFGKSGYSSVVGIAAAIKDDTSDAFFLRPLGNEFAHFAGESDFAVVLNRFECLDRRLLCTFLRLWQHSFDLWSGL